MVTGISILAFFVALFRFFLVPCALALFGGAAAALQIVTVTMPIFGQPVLFPLLLPLGIAILSIGAWLLVKGFAAPAQFPERRLCGRLCISISSLARWRSYSDTSLSSLPRDRACIVEAAGSSCTRCWRWRSADSPLRRDAASRQQSIFRRRC